MKFLVGIYFILVGCGALEDGIVLEMNVSNFDNEQSQEQNQEKEQEREISSEQYSNRPQKQEVEEEETKEAKEAKETIVEETGEVVEEIEYQLSDFKLEIVTGEPENIKWEQSFIEEVGLALTSDTTYDILISQNKKCKGNPIEITNISSNSLSKKLEEGVSYICVFARSGGKIKEAGNSPYYFEKQYTLTGLGYTWENVDLGYISGYFPDQSKPAGYSQDMDKGIRKVGQNCAGGDNLHFFPDGVVHESNGKIHIYSKSYWISNGCLGY